MGVTACVYFIWQERNRRLFTNEKRDWKMLLGLIVDVIGLKLTSLTVKKSKYVVMTKKCWKIKMNKVNSDEDLISEWKLP